MKEILTSYGIHEEISNANMISYRNTRSKVRLPDGDTQLFNITTGVPQVDKLAPSLFMICLDHILRNSLDPNHDLGFTLNNIKSRRPQTINITYVDYAYDNAILTDSMKYVTTLLYKIEEVSK